MTGPRIALVGPTDRPDALHARRALSVLAPDAQVVSLPTGAAPTPDLDGVWVLPSPETDPTVHDPTISWALHLGLPVVGPLGGDEGGARPAGDYLTAPGTTWTTDEPAGPAAPATVRSGGAPFATLSALPLAVEAGIHPVAVAFVEAARRHAGPTTAARSPFAPLPDDEPRSYVHQMRTTGYRWWRPLLALAAGIATFVVIAVALSILWFVLDPSMLDATGSADVDPAAPVTMLIGNLILAGLIPATMVATRVGHWRPVGKLFSVAGRIRWRWLLRAALVTTIVWGAYLAVMWFAGGEETSARPEHWPWLLVITVLTTPLQAAGEEVAFRGGLMQGVGAWIRRPVIALVVTTVLSAALFALAHTSLDPWVLLDLGGMAIACCYLTWRTGGLEAAIVLHVVNNLVITIGLTLLGGLQDAYVTEQTTSTAGTAGLGVLATFVMTAILLWQARRAGVAPKKLGAPATSSPAPADPLA